MVGEVLFDFDIFSCDKGFEHEHGVGLGVVGLDEVVIDADLFELSL